MEESKASGHFALQSERKAATTSTLTLNLVQVYIKDFIVIFGYLKAAMLSHFLRLGIKSNKLSIISQDTLLLYAPMQDYSFVQISKKTSTAGW